MKHITPYFPVNESFRQHGIILIKGKPKGKNKERFLYATHVNSSIEVKTGVTMLILSDTFYRIIKGDSGKLKGVRINWKDEESLKSAINFKSPGKLSVVKNNNKTPYHWKTLKHINLQDALSEIDDSLRDPDYIFESALQQTGDIYSKLISETIDSIFLGTRKPESVIVLSQSIPDNVIDDDISNNDDDDRSGTVEWTISLDCIYVGDPQLDEKLKELDLQKFSLNIDFESDYTYTSWYDPGDRDTPPDGGSEIDTVSTTIINIDIDGEEHKYEPSKEFESLVSEVDDHDIKSIISKNTAVFIKS